MMTLRKKILLAAVMFFFLILLISSFFGKKGLVEITQARKKYQALIQEIERLEKDKIRLEKEIRELEENPRAVEEDARKKLWMMKPGEKVMVKPKKKEKSE